MERMKIQKEKERWVQDTLNPSLKKSPETPPFLNVLPGTLLRNTAAYKGVRARERGLFWAEGFFPVIF